VEDLREYLTGWRAYFGFAEVQSPFKEWDSWGRRQRRYYVWKQGDGAGIGNSATGE
jgi:RNA-directed DNA polymerase